MYLRPLHRFYAFVFATITFVCFQNFGPIPIEKLKLARLNPVAEANARVELEGSAREGKADIRQLAPRRPASMDQYSATTIAVPQTGSDLGSISQDWFTRQANMITGGAEQRLLADVNKKMNRMMKFEPVKSEPWDSDSASSSGGSGPDMSFTTGSGSSENEEDENGDSSRSSYMGLKPTSMRLTAINKLEMGLANRTNVSCSFYSSNVQLDLSRRLSESVDLNLRHESSSNSNTVRLHYSW